MIIYWLELIELSGLMYKEDMIRSNWKKSTIQNPDKKYRPLNQYVCLAYLPIQQCMSYVTFTDQFMPSLCYIITQQSLYALSYHTIYKTTCNKKTWTRTVWQWQPLSNTAKQNMTLQNITYTRYSIVFLFTLHKISKYLLTCLQVAIFQAEFQ